MDICIPDDIIQIEEKAHIFPVELMTLAGGSTNEGQCPTRTMHLPNIKNTPDIESTRVPIETSTDKRGESKVPMLVSSPFKKLTMPKYEECALDTQYDKEQSSYIREEIESAEEERLRFLKEKQELQKQRQDEELKRAQPLLSKKGMIM